MNYKMILLRQC